MTRRNAMAASLLTAGAFVTAPATALAQAPAPERTITALASAAVPVIRPAHLSSATIAKAVDIARAKSGPAAVAHAREEAQRLAAASGLTLGALRAVSEQSGFPYGPFGGYGADGTFGPGKYCGTVRTAVFKRDSSGRRVFQHRFRSHFGCRVPRTATTTLAATFAAS